MAAERARRSAASYAGEHLDELLAEQEPEANAARDNLATALANVLKAYEEWQTTAHRTNELLLLAGVAARSTMPLLSATVQNICNEIRRFEAEIPTPMPLDPVTATLQEFRAPEPVELAIPDDRDRVHVARVRGT
jgi:hypothetical protein